MKIKYITIDAMTPYAVVFSPFIGHAEMLGKPVKIDKVVADFYALELSTGKTYPKSDTNDLQIPLIKLDDVKFSATQHGIVYNIIPKPQAQVS